MLQAAVREITLADSNIDLDHWLVYQSIVKQSERSAI